MLRSNWIIQYPTRDRYGSCVPVLLLWSACFLLTSPRSQASWPDVTISCKTGARSVTESRANTPPGEAAVKVADHEGWFRSASGEFKVLMVCASLPLPVAMAGGGLSVEGERYLLLLTFAVVVVATAMVWRLLILRHRQAVLALKEKEKAGELLAQEHARRLDAERESRVLAQCLLTAQEDERSHLARELHDDITQRLARLAIDAAQAERGLPHLGNGASPSMREELVRLSEDVHRLAYRLHPSILDELGLVEAVRAECDRTRRSGSISVKVTVRAVPSEISRQSALCLFRVAQESLRNVVRHARAKTVHVSLAEMDGGLQLSVQDDGVGFDPAKSGARRSLGHAGMRERVQMLGGELDLESEPGHGTTIVAWVPVKEKATP